jgi:hypothetical protein
VWVDAELAIGNRQKRTEVLDANASKMEQQQFWSTHQNRRTLPFRLPLLVLLEHWHSIVEPPYWLGVPFKK